MNLKSLLSAQEFLKEKTFSTYKKRNNINIDDAELTEVKSLIENLESNPLFEDNNIELSNHFYVGFTIDQIGKEFDLLRFGINYSINIELKRESTEEKILKQLKKNKYYLNFLEVDFHYITYVKKDHKFYTLNEYELLEEVSNEYLINLLYNQKVNFETDVNQYFNASNYLVSPFNSTEKFIKNEYFLTKHQDSIKSETINNLSQFIFSSIEGSAGTGKTLLSYDIVKSCMEKNLKTLILHCGKLNTGHNKLIYDYKWNISAINGYESKLNPELDLILIDEAQRIYPDQLQIIIQYAKKNNISCLFSFDSVQCLSNKEITNDISSIIKKETTYNKTLTKKIRTNKELANFIKYFFNSPVNTPDFDEIKRSDFSNIDIQYFKDSTMAKEYVKNLQNYNWKHVNYTTSTYYAESLDKTIIQSSNINSHEVIGQEFDNVVVIIDETFAYHDNKLGGVTNTYYNSTKMLFQMLTRARKKLCLVILNNEKVLEKCLDLVSK